MGEHETEPVEGLPEPLPAGEQILWQGSPRWQTLARRAFHTRKLAVYFGLLLVWRGASLLIGGSSLGQAGIAVAWLLPLAAAAIGALSLLAWLIGRTTVYTVTNERVVMRIGIVLTITLNIPFRSIETAGLLTYADGTGDIPLTLAGSDRIAIIHLWPHARPWHLKRPEPMMRAIPDAARVGEILSRAIAASAGAPLRQMPAAAPVVRAPARQSRSVATATAR